MDTTAQNVGKPMNSTQKEQAEGQRSRQAVLDYLLEVMTSPANPTTAEQLREFKMTSHYFPDIKQAIEKVNRSFSNTPDLRKVILLAGAVLILNLLIE